MTMHRHNLVMLVVLLLALLPAKSSQLDENTSPELELHKAVLMDRLAFLSDLRSQIEQIPSSSSSSEKAKSPLLISLAQLAETTAIHLDKLGLPIAQQHQQQQQHTLSQTSVHAAHTESTSSHSSSSTEHEAETHADEHEEANADEEESCPECENECECGEEETLAYLPFFGFVQIFVVVLVVALGLACLSVVCSQLQPRKPPLKHPPSDAELRLRRNLKDVLD